MNGEKRHVGKLSDLGEPKFRGTKERYYCPYCTTVFRKSQSREATISYDPRSGMGVCFRCGTLIIYEGLTSLDYIADELNPKKKSNEKEKIKSQRVRMDWTLPVMGNKNAWEYLHNRFITNDSMKRFNVRCCLDPFLAIVYVNKTIDSKFTDFMQVRIVDGETRHLFLKDQAKVCNWLHHADSNNLVIVEGYTSGLSAYQHSLELDFHLNPVILGGKTITDYQLSELQEFCSKEKEVNIWVCLDGGFLEDALKLAKRIYNRCYNSTVHIINLPYMQDPNDVNSVTFKEHFEICEEYSPDKMHYIRDKVYNNVLRREHQKSTKDN